MEEHKENTGSAETAHGDSKILMGILCYLGPFVIIPLFIFRNNSFVNFHIKQGLVLLTLEIVLWLTGTIFWPFKPIVGAINIALLVLIIIGIINVLRVREREIPLLGNFAKHFNI